MEMVYAALLLHSLGKPVDEASVKKVMEAAGGKPESAQIKALVSSLKDVDIEEAIKQAAAVQAAPQATAESGEKKEEEKEEEKEEKEEEKAEEAAAGLGALFG